MNERGRWAFSWAALVVASSSVACAARCPDARHAVAGGEVPRSSTSAAPAAVAAPVTRFPRFLLKQDANVKVDEPAPHQGVGKTTAFRYFDELKDAGLIFRKRALHPGAAHGLNVLKHDEVFYVLSGRGELEVDDQKLALEPGTAVFMYLGAAIRLRQLGDEDLVVIIAYPPASSH